MEFSIEPISQVWEEMTSDWISNWGKEYVEKGEPPDLSLDRYKQYEDFGMYIQFVARDKGKLAGYLGAYLTRSMHSQKLIAAEDILYMKPEYRNGINSKRFVEYIENALKEKGAISITCTVKPESQAARLLNHMNYELVMYQYEKRLT
jgi:hypothetical protein